MSYRFRKAIKIAPGLKLNMGRGGLSFSAGVPGFRLTFGKSGVWGTAGLPGTGLSYRKKLTTCRSVPSEDPQPLSANGTNLIRITSSDQLQDYIQSGKVIVNPESGRPFTQLQLSRLLKKIKKQEVLQKNAAIVEHEKLVNEKIMNISKGISKIPDLEHWDTMLKPRPFWGVPFSEPEPKIEDVEARINTELRKEHQLSLYGYSAMYLALAGSVVILMQQNWSLAIGTLLFIGASMLIYVKSEKKCKLQTTAHQLAEQSMMELLKKHKDKGELHLAKMRELEEVHIKKEEERISELKLLFSGDKASMERELQEVLTNIALPLETEVAFEVKDEECVFLDIDLPEIEDCIRPFIYILQRRGGIKEKSKSQQQQNKEYLKVVTGLAFYFVFKVILTCPSVNKIIASGYTQRINKRTGQEEDQYIYSIIIDKDTFCEIDFAWAEPDEAVKNFDIRWSLGRNSELSVIKPFSLDEVSHPKQDVDDTDCNSGR